MTEIIARALVFFIFQNSSYPSPETKVEKRDFFFVLFRRDTTLFLPHNKTGPASQMLDPSLPRCQKPLRAFWGLVFFWVSLLLWVDLGGAGEQLVPAHHTLTKVDFVQPDIGLPDQGLLHKLTTVGHQEQLEKWREQDMPWLVITSFAWGETDLSTFSRWGLPVMSARWGSYRNGRFRWKTVPDHDDTLWSFSWWSFSGWQCSPHRAWRKDLHTHTQTHTPL